MDIAAMYAMRDERERLCRLGRQYERELERRRWEEERRQQAEKPKEAANDH